MAILCALGLSAFGAELFTVNVGSSANDRTGDPLRTAFQKLNSNDVMLAEAIGVGLGGARILTNGGANVFTMGKGAGSAGLVGSNVVGFGDHVLPANSNSSFVVALGSYALYSLWTGDDHVAVGHNAGMNLINGGQDVMVGTSCGYFNTNGSRNTFVGHHSGMNSASGCDNTGVGSAALQNGTSFASIGTGWRNSAVGSWSLYKATDGSDNASIGFQSGVGDGVNTFPVTTGNSNTFIGSQSGLGTTNQRTGLTVIGAMASGNADNAVILGKVGDRVGVGTNAPVAQVDIQGNGGAKGYILRVGSAAIAGRTNAFTVHTNGSGSIGGSLAPDSFYGTALAVGHDGANKVLAGNFGGTYASVIGLDTTLSAYAPLCLRGNYLELFGAGTVLGLRVQTDGTVGIQTNAPAAALHVGNGGNAIVDGSVTSRAHAGALGTNVVYGSLTNAVADFGQQYSVVFATNDLNFVHSTNRAAGRWLSAVFKIYAGVTNRQVWLNPAWVPLGATTNYFVLGSNKVAVVSLGQDGASETNVTAVAVVQP